MEERESKPFFPWRRILLEGVLALSLGFLVSLLADFDISPIYPGTSISTWCVDSDYFLYEASYLLAGGRPYVDFLDHKGMFHVYVVALGLLIDREWGVFLLSVLSLGVASFSLFRAMDFHRGGKERWPRLLLGQLILIGLRLLMLVGGTHEGQWILPFVSLGFALLVRWASLGNSLPSLLASMAFLGTGAGFALMSRPLDVLPCLLPCLAYFFLFLRERRKGTELLLAAGTALLSCSLSSGVFLLLAHLEGYLPRMMELLISGNGSYLASLGGENYGWLTFFFNVFLNLAFAGLFLFLFFRGRTAGSLLKPLYLAASVYFLLMAPLGRYSNYYWPGIMAFSFLLGEIELPEKAKKPAFLSSSLAFLLLDVLLLALPIGLYWTPGADWRGLSAEKVALYREDLYLLPEEAKEEGEVLALNMDSCLYLLGDFFPGCPYVAYQSWWGAFDGRVLEEVRDALREDPPSYLLLGGRDEEKTWRDFGDILEDYLPYRAEEIRNPDWKIYVFQG